MSLNDLRQELVMLKKREPQRPTKPQYLLDDITPESLAFALHSNGGAAALVSDEGGTILNGRSVQNIPQLNKGWSGSMLSISRKASPSFTVDSPRLTISIMTQPSEMDKFMKKRGEESRGVGFLARFLVCAPWSTQGSRYMENV
jgi:hypothetical protein